MARCTTRIVDIPQSRAAMRGADDASAQRSVMRVSRASDVHVSAAVYTRGMHDDV